MPARLTVLAIASNAKGTRFIFESALRLEQFFIGHAVSRRGWPVGVLNDSGRGLAYSQSAMHLAVGGLNRDGILP